MLFVSDPNAFLCFLVNSNRLNHLVGLFARHYLYGICGFSWLPQGITNDPPATPHLKTVGNRAFRDLRITKSSALMMHYSQVGLAMVPVLAEFVFACSAWLRSSVDPIRVDPNGYSRILVL
jgi:hypothetical protein